jgi:DnaK suppressor protein
MIECLKNNRGELGNGGREGIRFATCLRSQLKKRRSRNLPKKTAKKAAPAKKAAVKSIPVKKAPGKPFPSKTTLTVDEKSQTVSVSTITAPVVAPVIEERRLVMPPPPRPVKSGKKIAPLKPIKVAPTPVVVSENESPWTAAEIKAIKSEISKELDRLRKELAVVEQEMDALIQESGEGPSACCASRRKNGANSAHVAHTL